MIWLTLIKADLRGWWNQLRHGGGSQRRSRFQLLILIAVGLAILYPVFRFGFSLGHSNNRSPIILIASFTALALFVLIFCVAGIIEAFFGDRRLLLLAAAPISTTQVFIARMLKICSTTSVAAVVQLSLLAGYGLGAGAPLVYYPATVVAIFLLVGSAVALPVVVFSGVLRIAPLSRARDLASILSALLAIPAYAVYFWITTSSSSQGQIGDGFTQALVSASDRLGWIPTAWPAMTIYTLAHHDGRESIFWFAATGVLAIALVGSAGWIHRWAFRIGLGVYGQSGA
ncbi:MAG: hypothetical protein ACREP9_08065, partial [Candidatus Dormibacteraceae bacterium]